MAGKRIWVAGHTGMLGSALVRELDRRGFRDVVGADRRALDLRDGDATLRWAKAVKPSVVFLPAGTIGGILANKTRPAEFMRDNILIAVSVIDAARKIGVEKLIYVASSAVYPVSAAQPLREASLMTGHLEEAHEGYSMAKLTGIKLCETYQRQYRANFIAALPTNLYGPGDRYDLENSHVIPALIRKAEEARLRGETDLHVWGSGQARRDFLHVDDCARALCHLMEYHGGKAPVNVGSGIDLTIADLARTIMRVAGLTGDLVFDPERPDGAPRRQLDIEVLESLGWKPEITLEAGLAQALTDYRERLATPAI
nr:GDP-L-fucose synthase [Maricaulis parjimensis]